jgi:hypothetical protein
VTIWERIKHVKTKRIGSTARILRFTTIGGFLLFYSPHNVVVETGRIFSEG